jgi:hypothetical protein
MPAWVYAEAVMSLPLNLFYIKYCDARGGLYTLGTDPRRPLAPKPLLSAWNRPMTSHLAAGGQPRQDGEYSCDIRTLRNNIKAGNCALLSTGRNAFHTSLEKRHEPCTWATSTPGDTRLDAVADHHPLSATGFIPTQPVATRSVSRRAGIEDLCDSGA